MDPLIVSIVATSTFVVSFIIVAFDPSQRYRLKMLAAALVPTLIALPLVGAVWWLYLTGFEPLGGLGDKMLCEAQNLIGQSTLTFFWYWLMAPVAGLADVLVTIGILVAATVAVVTALGALLPAVPTLIALPLLALPPIVRGVWTIVALPFLGLREVFYFFNHPPALREIKRVTQSKDASQEDVAQATRSLLNEYEKTREATAKPWKKPTTVLAAHLHHYSAFLSKHRLHVLNAYTKVIGETADELRKDTERRRQANKRGRNDE